MSKSIKAIPTVFKGIQFKSRLEARWAVVMWKLGIKYIYEMEGFQLGKMRYLPDFFLPELDMYLEIKPFSPTPKEEKKCKKLSEATKKPVVCLFGQPIEYAGYDSDGGYLYLPHKGGWDNCYRFVICSLCFKGGIEFERRNERLSCKCDKTGRDGRWDDVQKILLNNAYFTAQNYDFENYRKV